MSNKETSSSVIPAVVKQNSLITISDDAEKLEAKKFSWKNVSLWALNSIANGSFTQGIIGIAFISISVYLGMQEEFTYFWSFFAMTLALAISNLLSVIFAPIIGTLTDVLGKRKIFVIILSGVGSLLIAFCVTWLNFYFTIILFLIGNFFFQLGCVAYNSQVSFISHVNKRGITFGLSGLFNFFGSIIALVILLISNSAFGLATNLSDLQEAIVSPEHLSFGGLRFVFLICALVMLLSLIPYMFHKEKVVENHKEKLTRDNIKQRTVSELKAGFKESLGNRNVLLLLISWFLVSVGITIVTIYMFDLTLRITGIDNWIAILVLIEIALAAIVSSFITGSFIDEIGPKFSFIINSVFIVIGIFLSAIPNYTHVSVSQPYLSSGHAVSVTTISIIPWWVIFFGAFFVGIAIGGFWVFGKYFILELAPTKRIGQTFGIFGIVTQTATAVSPIVFYGMISLLNNRWSDDTSYRISLFIILGFFLVCIPLVGFIKENHPRYLMGERVPYTKSEVKIKQRSKKMNFFVTQLYRLEFLFQKFRVVIGAINASNYFLLLLVYGFDINLPWWSFLIAVVVGIPLLILFVFIIEIFDGAWNEARWAQYRIVERELFEMKVHMNMLLQARAYKQDKETRTKRSAELHKRLSIDDITIELDILKEIREQRKKYSEK
ncbi:MAG: MFS transporter [Candidatus Heimdallarchaeota archaeon]